MCSYYLAHLSRLRLHGLLSSQQRLCLRAIHGWRERKLLHFVIAVEVAEIVLLLKDLLLTLAVIRRALGLLTFDGVQLYLKHAGVLLIDVDEGTLWFQLFLRLLHIVGVVFEELLLNAFKSIALAVAFLVCLDISAELTFWCLAEIQVTFSLSLGFMLKR